MNVRKSFILLLLLEMMLGINGLSAVTPAIPYPPADTVGIVVYRGLVVDRLSGAPLAFASILLNGTNITTVTNSEGDFSLKVPKDRLNGSISITFLGYRSKIIPLASLKTESNRMELEITSRQLPEINVVMSDAASLVRAMISKKGENYPDSTLLMTAFYRETIKKRRSYVSLQEAVVDICKYPYLSRRNDWASLYKVRKQTDYQKLDTVVFKLMGGPYNNLFSDVVKNSEDFFTEDMNKNYEFTFDRTMQIDSRTVYVVDFEQRPTVLEPLYYGTLYIDAESLALISAEFGVNLDNRDEASKIFIKKKPLNARVYPTKSSCKVDYLKIGDKWYLNYCRVELDIYINWKRKLFNTQYESTMEMAVTDWMPANANENKLKTMNKMKVSDIVAEQVSGFADPSFWGEMNVIEPEKSILSAIKKIQKQLKKK